MWTLWNNKYIKHGQKLTGVDKIYAVIGGFHEEWNPIEKIEEKVKYLEALNPEITCGMHCTGFKFNKLMSRPITYFRNRRYRIPLIKKSFYF